MGVGTMGSEVVRRRSEPGSFCEEEGPAPRARTRRKCHRSVAESLQVLMVLDAGHTGLPESLQNTACRAAWEELWEHRAEAGYDRADRWFCAGEVLRLEAHRMIAQTY